MEVLMIKKIHFKKVIPLCLVAILSFAQITQAVTVPNLNPDKLHASAKTFISQKDYSKAIAYLLAAHKKNPSAAVKRDIADTYVALDKYEEAVPYYNQAAAIYDKIGDVNGAIALRNKANAIASTIEVFVKQTVSPATTPLAKFEPRYGAYIGAFVEYDTNVGHKNVAKFNSLMEKDHSIYFTYHKYGNPFPTGWAAQVKDTGAAVHLALEPNDGLQAVQDNAYLREFAREAKAFGAPIFLRFASEMNGNWVPWNGNPELYKQKFQLVAKVMREEAPNVAMVWVPNSAPIPEITKYYPGDAAVDWVGVNLYNVKFFNGDPKQPADQVNPNDLFEFVYNTYSAKKPIMIGEYGATHFSKAGNMDTTQLSMSKMRIMYEGMQLKYPRIKAINWFSCNTITHAHSEARKLNNFSLTENPKVKSAYQQVIKNDYFLSQVVNGPTASTEASASRSIYKPLQNVSGVVQGASWVTTYDPYISKVVYKVNDQYLSESTTFPYNFTLDSTKLKKGKHTLNVIVFDSKGKVASRKNINFNVQ